MNGPNDAPRSDEETDGRIATLTKPLVELRQAAATRFDRHFVKVVVGVAMFHFATGMASAQSSVDCSSTFMQGTDQTISWAAGILIAGSLAAAIAAQGVGNLKKDPSQKQEWRRYRNGALGGVVGIPFLGWAGSKIAANYGIAAAECITFGL